MSAQKRIVAEVSVSWPRDGYQFHEGERVAISQKFEDVIKVNDERGYDLESWEFHQVSPYPQIVIETIIAIFKAR